MKLATLFLLVYSGTAQAIARPVGLSATLALGEVTARGSASPSTYDFDVVRPLGPLPAMVGARAYPSGLWGRVQMGRVAASGAARATTDGLEAQVLLGRPIASGAARISLAGLQAALSWAPEVRTRAAGRARPVGLHGRCEVGTAIGHPTAAEAAEITRLNALFDDEALLLLGALDL